MSGYIIPISAESNLLHSNLDCHGRNQSINTILCISFNDIKNHYILYQGTEHNIFKCHIQCNFQTSSLPWCFHHVRFIWDNSYQARLAGYSKWVWFSLDVPYFWPFAKLESLLSDNSWEGYSKKKLSLINYFSVELR